MKELLYIFSAICVVAFFGFVVMKSVRDWLKYESKAPVTQQEAEEMMDGLNTDIIYVCSDRWGFDEYHEAIKHSESLENKEVSTYIRQEE